MLEEVLTLALVLSIYTHALLVKKCASLQEEIPAQTGAVHNTMSEVRDLLDEALDMITGLASAVPDVMPNPAPSESLPNMILATLLSRMGMGEADASKTQPQEWEVLSPNDPTTDPTLQGVEPDQHG